MRSILPYIGVALLLLVSLTPSALATNEVLEPRAGDRVVVDIGRSIVYVVHADGNFYTMEGLTGQYRTVSYDGITYNAKTPLREWELRSFEEKGKSTTFGNGRFGRLSWPGHKDPRHGDERTAYGFHSHRSFERMLQDKAEQTAWDRTGTGHRSMGCIIVSEEDLTILEETWKMNGGVLLVTTQEHVDTAVFSNTSVINNGADPPTWFGLSR